MDTVLKSIEGSYCMGIYNSEGQVGFGRIITDYATFGYLADVFVLEEHRGKALSKELMNFVMQQEWVKGLRNFMLGTADAHTLYEKYGFTRLKDVNRYMYIYKPGAYEGS